MAKAILLKFAQVNLWAKLSQHTSVTQRLRPKHVFVLGLKNSLRLTGGYSVTNGMTTPEVCALTDVSFNKFQHQSEELGVGGITMYLPTAPTWPSCLIPNSDQKSLGLVIQTCAFWQPQNGSITVRHHISTEERKSLRRARVQEELNMIHYSRAAACLFTRLRAEESSDFSGAHCGVSSREKPFEIVIYLYVCVLIYDILEYMYPSACDKKFIVYLDPYLVQCKYIFRNIYLN